MSSYNDLDIYKMAYKFALVVDHLSLTLPKYELYEQGGQVRRSSKSIKDTIAKGYGRKRYKADFIKFLNYPQAFCNETISQLTMISELYFSENPLNQLIENYNLLGSKINKFIQYVESYWRTKNKQQITNNNTIETQKVKKLKLQKLSQKKFY